VPGKREGEREERARGKQTERSRSGWSGRRRGESAERGRTREDEGGRGAEKIVEEGARGKARARAPRRKRFGLFQFDFSSVAVALTTIRRRGADLFSLSLTPFRCSTSHILSSLSLPFLFYRCFSTPSLFRYLSPSPLLYPSPASSPSPLRNGTNEWVTPRCAHRTLVNRVVSPLRGGPPLLSGVLSASRRGWSTPTTRNPKRGV